MLSDVASSLCAPRPLLVLEKVVENGKYIFGGGDVQQLDVFYLISISCNMNQILKLAVVFLGVCCPILLVHLPVGILVALTF